MLAGLARRILLAGHKMDLVAAIRKAPSGASRNHYSRDSNPLKAHKTRSKRDRRLALNETGTPQWHQLPIGCPETIQPGIWRRQDTFPVSITWAVVPDLVTLLTTGSALDAML